MSVTTEGFRDLTGRAMALADELCGGRLVVVLEGGYSLEQLPFCNLAIAERLAGLEPSFSEDPLELDIPRGLRDPSATAVEAGGAAAAQAVRSRPTDAYSSGKSGSARIESRSARPRGPLGDPAVGAGEGRCAGA